MVRWITLLVTLIPVSGGVLALTPTEEKIISSIEQEEPLAKKFLESVVNINSGTMNFDGVRRVGRLFDAEYRKLGFKTQWIDGKDFGRAGHFVAHHGHHGIRLLLIGHLDTVFPAASTLQKFRPLTADLVRGPGITDMKGGDVIMLYALRALKSAGVLDRIRVRVILTGDEEKRGSPIGLATRALVEGGRWADVAIGFEDGDGDPGTAVISRRGAGNWLLRVEGRPAHSSQIFREGYGYGAIFETARILQQFREGLASENHLTLNPALVTGGTEADLDRNSARGTAFGKSNVIPQLTLVSGDIRALTPGQLQRAKRKMQRIVADGLAQTHAELQFFPGYPPMAPTPGNRELLDLYSAVSEELGYGRVLAVDPRRAGAADISFVASQVGMSIDGLGLMGSGGHTEQETADMTTLISQTQRAALLMHRLGAPKQD